MTALMISYDLHKLGQRYTLLRARIKANFPTHWNCLESTFIVVTKLTPVQVRDLLKTDLDGNDELLVVMLQPSAWGSIGLSKECNDWLRNHV